MHTQARTNKLSWPVVAIAAALLAACAAPAPRERTDTPDTTVAARLAELGRPAEAAAIYAQAADRAPAAEASRLRVRAAELQRDAGDYAAARALLDRVDLTTLDDYGTVLAQLLSSELALVDGRPADALRQLPRNLSTLPRGLTARTLQLQGDAYLLLGQPSTAVERFVAREAFLTLESDVSANHQQIWRALRQIDSADVSGGDPVLDGWLALVELRRRAWQDPWNFDAAVAAWRRAYPAHPAITTFLPRLMDEQRRLSVGVREFAVLLPLSGRFASAGEAVRDGFLAALYRSPADARRPVVRFYDTGESPERAVEYYRDAVASGADFVVGPLQKEAVAALAEAGGLTVPVLALNTVDYGVTPTSFYSFGLVPEDEAIQIADRAILSGHTRAVALVPDSELGARMLNAFANQFEEQGGAVLATQWYDPSQRDHSAPITRALAIDESRARLSTLRVVLRADLQAEPRRRRDADFVFIVATPQQARSLRPQLRFHHASDLPVFASSHLYTGVADRSADGDLNGIAFTDMPWVIDPDPETARTRQQLADEFGSDMERNTRLFALGYDAYRLAPVLRHDPALLREPMPAATGALHLTDDGRIQRSLVWAQFSGGLARPFEFPTEFEAPPTP